MTIKSCKASTITSFVESPADISNTHQESTIAKSIDARILLYYYKIAEDHA
jgi:hypothetical protein